MSVRVLCVDDHAILVEGLKAQFAIDNRIQCIGYLPSAAKLIDEVARLKPDVVLLDIEMPGPDVFEMADRLRHMHPGVRFIFLSAHVRDGYLVAAYKCGAWGYFAKGDDLEHIVSGIKEVARSNEGVFVMGPKVKLRCQPAKAAGLYGRSQSNQKIDSRPKTALEGLTPREIEVLRLIGKGRSRNEIAAEFSRSSCGSLSARDWPKRDARAGRRASPTGPMAPISNPGRRAGWLAVGLCD
jgi:DNA-binding NarL/FixJ family response regulator